MAWICCVCHGIWHGGAVLKTAFMVWYSFVLNCIGLIKVLEPCVYGVPFERLKAITFAERCFFTR